MAALRRVVENEYVADSNQKHEIRFAGKGLADHLADSPTGMELRVERGQGKDFDATSNVVIRGDNLDVLKVLRNNYHGSVKVAYIDPPYNTESDEFVYNDYFKKSEAELIEDMRLAKETIERFQDLYGTKTHGGWLAFMWHMLKVARDLLTCDGVIFILIDDNEQANLRNVCDEIFGTSSFIACIVVNVNPGRRAYNEIATNHEYILCYGNGSSTRINLIPKTNNDMRFEDDNGTYKLGEMRNSNPKFTRKNRPNLYYPIYANPKSANKNRECSVSLTKTKLHNVKVLLRNSKGKDDCWRRGKEKTGYNVGIDPSRQQSRGQTKEEWRMERLPKV